MGKASNQRKHWPEAAVKKEGGEARCRNTSHQSVAAVPPGISLGWEGRSVGPVAALSVKTASVSPYVTRRPVDA